MVVSGNCDSRVVVAIILRAAAEYDERYSSASREAWNAWDRAVTAPRPWITAAEGAQVVQEHFARSTDPITPEGLLRAVREARSRRYRAEIIAPPANPALPAQEAAQLDLFLARAATITCPICPAAPGEPCINQLTGRPFRNGHPHPQRVKESQ